MVTHLDFFRCKLPVLFVPVLRSNVVPTLPPVFVEQFVVHAIRVLILKLTLSYLE